jgi:hypothetical protein
MKAIVATLGVTLSALTLVAWLVSTDPGVELLTPDVHAVVQAFVMNLAINRPEQAHERLTEDTRASVTPERLATLGRAWRVDHGRFRLDDGELEREGDRATFHARIDTAERGMVERTFELRRNARTRLWQIDAFDGLSVMRHPAPASSSVDRPGTSSPAA